MKWLWIAMFLVLSLAVPARAQCGPRGCAGGSWFVRPSSAPAYYQVPQARYYQSQPAYYYAPAPAAPRILIPAPALPAPRRAPVTPPDTRTPQQTSLSR